MPRGQNPEFLEQAEAAKRDARFLGQVGKIGERGSDGRIDPDDGKA